MAYHVTLGDHRTTVSIDNILSELLALKLGYAPDAPEAHAAVRQWLQDRLDQANDPDRDRTSQWLQARIVEAIVSNKLALAHDRWSNKKRAGDRARRRSGRRS
jgi:hypothetical protein